MLFTLVGILLLSSLLHFLYLNFWRHASIRGPIAIPWLGNLLSLDVDALHQSVSEFALKRFSSRKMFKFWILNDPLIVINEPELIGDMLVKQMPVFDRNKVVQETFGPVIGGLFGMDNGEMHKTMRRLFQPFFKSSYMHQFLPMILEKINITLGILDSAAKSGEQIDCEYTIHSLTFDVIGVMVLGIEFNSQGDKNNTFAKAWNQVLQHLMWRYMVRVPYWDYIKTKDVRDYEKNHAFITKTIHERVKKYQENPESLQGDLAMLAFLMRERNSDEELKASLSDHMLVKQVINMLFAGHDTTTNLIAWVLYYLSENPKVEQTLQAEIDTILATNNGQLTIELLKKMKYLKAVLQETLRLKPSAPLLPRELNQDTDFAGKKFSKGDRFLYCPYSIHRNPEVFKNPNDFVPERFLDHQYGTRAFPPYAFIPFGAGFRNCIGQKMALEESSIILAMIVHKYSLRVVPGKKVEERLSATMRVKNGFPVTVTKRK